LDGKLLVVGFQRLTADLSTWQVKSSASESEITADQNLLFFPYTAAAVTFP
jgi:hypothetical protein